MYPLFESIRVENGSIVHPDWHQKRFLASYTLYYGHEPSIGLFDSLDIPETCRKGIFKLRISYNHESRQVDWQPYTTGQISNLRLIKDDDIDYSLKYTDRSRLNNLYDQRNGCDDILIVRRGLITDSSYCNIVLFDGDKWFTPAEPLLPGTARARLLASGQIIARPIRVEDLVGYKSFKLINAMRDFEILPSVSIENIRNDDRC